MFTGGGILASFGMKALGWLFGGGANGLAESIATTVREKIKAGADTQNIQTQAERDLALKAFDVQVEQWREQAKLNWYDRGHWSTRWIRPAFAAWAFYYAACYVLNKAHGFFPNLKTLDEPWLYLVLGIIGSFFLLSPYEKQKRAAAIEKLKTK